MFLDDLSCFPAVQSAGQRLVEGHGDVANLVRLGDDTPGRDRLVPGGSGEAGAREVQQAQRPGPEQVAGCRGERDDPDLDVLLELVERAQQVVELAAEHQGPAHLLSKRGLTDYRRQMQWVGAAKSVLPATSSRDALLDLDRSNTGVRVHYLSGVVGCLQ